MLDDYKELFKFYPENQSLKLNLATLYSTLNQLDPAENAISGNN